MAAETQDWTSEDQISGVARGDYEILEVALALHDRNLERSGLDGRAHALVKIASLVALDAPPASYLWQVANALEAGVTPDDLLGVLISVAPQVGLPKVMAGAAGLVEALDITTEE